MPWPGPIDEWFAALFSCWTRRPGERNAAPFLVTMIPDRRTEKGLADKRQDHFRDHTQARAHFFEAVVLSSLTDDADRISGWQKNPMCATISSNSRLQVRVPESQLDSAAQPSGEMPTELSKSPTAPPRKPFVFAASSAWDDDGELVHIQTGG